jgi:hypothetical protein
MTFPADLAYRGTDLLAVGVPDRSANGSDPDEESGVETGRTSEWAVHNTAVLTSIHAQAGRSEGCATKVRHGPSRQSLNLDLRQPAAICGNLRRYAATCGTRPACSGRPGDSPVAKKFLPL